MSSKHHHLDEWAALVGADLPEDAEQTGRRGRDDASTDATTHDAR